MRRNIIVVACLTVILFAGSLPAQNQLRIHAASAEPVSGWNRMEFGQRAVWVNPTASLTSADIASADPSTDADRGTFIEVVFTDEGTKKMRALSNAQRNKLIAMVVNGQVIFAPTVRAEIGRESIITGSGPNGLTTTEVQDILAAINRK
jgi:preprotein translocase subunit SecD